MERTRYKIKKIIGEGASGTVYKAVDTTNSQEVAIKSYSRQSIGKNHEYRILEELDYEHIVKLYGPGQTSRIVVLELCECNLISFINEFELDLKCIRKIMRMLLLALNYIHERGIIHRDVKLGNILIKNNVAKLCDFGLACYKSENDYSYCGTKDYLAPEIEAIKQAGKDQRLIKYDCKADIYASGIVFRALITNNKEVEVDGEQISGLERELLDRLLEKKPEKRISAAEALKHTVFGDIFPKVPDFRILQAFCKNLKHGKIVKGNDFIEVQYKTNRNFSLKVELIDCKDPDNNAELDLENSKNHGNFGYNSSTIRNADKEPEMNKEILNLPSNMAKLDVNLCFDKVESAQRMGVNKSSCRCFENLNYRILLNGKHIKREFLAETEVKYFTYLCNYIVVILERVVKTKIEDFGYVFAITGNDTKVLKCKEYELSKPKDGKMTITKHNLSKSEFIPEDARKFFKYFDDAAKQIPHKCYTAANMPGSYSNISIMSGFDDPLVKKYEFIENMGWCIRNKQDLIFLLNNGIRFTLNLYDLMIITNDNKRIELKKGMDELFEGSLIIIRSFLQKFLR